MKWRYYFMLITVFCFKSCASQNQFTIQDFINNYGEYSFGEFKNYSVFVRSYEDRGENVCVMVTNEKDTGVCQLPYTLVIERKTLKITEIRKNDRENQLCVLDTSIAQKLAVELLKMNIHGIGVDSNNNVFVNVRFNEEQTAELIRFSDKKFITDRYKKNYKHLDSGWYIRKDANFPE